MFKSYKQTIIDNDDYTAELEYAEGLVFLHCDVRNINKSIFNRMVDDWMDMEEALRQEGLDKVYAVPEKTRFVEHTGWELLTTIPYQGEERGVYVWELPLE